MIMDHTMIKENSQLRREAREQLKGNWFMAILLCIVSSVISGLPGMIPILGPIISLVIAGPLALGLSSCFLSLIRTQKFAVEELFSGFYNFLPSFLVYLLMCLFIFLWSLLLFIPGVIASLSYSMSIFILHDNPEMKAMDALRASKEMMKGYKFKLFRLYFSFIGWMLLGGIVVAIGFVVFIPLAANSAAPLIIWGIISALASIVGYAFLIPYMYNAFANFYENLRENQAY